MFPDELFIVLDEGLDVLFGGGVFTALGKTDLENALLLEFLEVLFEVEVDGLVLDAVIEF